MPRHVITAAPDKLLSQPSPAARLRGLHEGLEATDEKHTPKLAVLPSRRSDRKTPGHGPADGFDSRFALNEQSSQLEIPFLWIEKAISGRLAKVIAAIDRIPLKLETHQTWAEARHEACSAMEAIVELRRAAYQMLGSNSRLAICHVKSKAEPKTKPR